MYRLSVLLVVLAFVVGQEVFAADGFPAPGRSTTLFQGTPARRITAVGTIEPEAVADVSAQVSGTIVSLGGDPKAAGRSIDYGSTVEVGTVLAQIDRELYQARVDQEQAACARAEAELAQTKTNLERAEALWKRAQELQKSNAISAVDFEAAMFNSKSAKNAVAMAEAMVAQNKAALRQALIELSYTTIKSPIKGVVIDRRVNLGQTVGPGNGPGLFLVAKLDNLQVWASVNEADIAQVRPQQAVRFVVDAYRGSNFEGKVRQIRHNATMSRNTVTYTVVIDITSPADKLLPYMTARLEFEP